MHEVGADINISEIIPALEELLGLAFDFAPNVIFVLIMVVLILILSVLFSLLSLYLCIAIGQLWTAHRILGSIIAYIALSFALNVVVTVAMIIFVLVSVQSLTAFNITLVVCAITMAAAVAACYYATVRIFKTKLNLQ